MSASLDVQPVDEPRLRLPAPGGILASAPARQRAPAMSGGWDANGEYVPLGAVDASVEVGHLDDTRDSEEEARGEPGRGDKRATSPRWGKVRREVRASVAVAKVAAAFAGTESFETLAAQAAARRLMAAGAPAATRCRTRGCTQPGRNSPASSKGESASRHSKSRMPKAHQSCATPSLLPRSASGDMYDAVLGIG